MLELLYTTLALFVFLFGSLCLCFTFFKKFKYMKYFILIIQMIISFISFFLFILYYGQHSLLGISEPSKIKFENIHNLTNSPIKSLYANHDENGNFISIGYDIMDDKTFSLIKFGEYTKQCLENYFIKEIESCPITDIKLVNNKNIENNDYIKISEDEYLYYIKENKNGKLYKSFNYYDFKENKEDLISIDKIIKKEYHKLSNPFLGFKYYVLFYDVFCFFFLFFSLISLIIFESTEELKFDLFKIVNLLIQLVILIIYLIRFFKFVKVKKFLFENKDIYANESYFPNKVFNIDSFLPGLSISYCLIYILYILVLNKISFFKEEDNNNDNNNNSKSNRDNIYNLFLILLYTSSACFLAWDISNDFNITNDYNEILHNWNSNPIKSINLIKDIPYNEYITDLNSYIFIEKYHNFNYLNMYQNKEGKICGKDSYGNYLYFPEEIDCPINKIFFSDFDYDLPGYIKIKLNNYYYLYYTNQNTDGEIAIDIEEDYSFYNSEYGNYLMPYFEKIDSKYLGNYYSIYYYQGINTTLIGDNKYKINNFDKKINIYRYIYIAKIIFLSSEIVLLLLLIILFNLFITFFNDYSKYFLLTFLILDIIYIIIAITCLAFHLREVTNFINIIYLKYEKRDFKWNLIMLIISSISFVFGFLLFMHDCWDYKFPDEKRKIKKIEEKLEMERQRLNLKQEYYERIQKELEDLRANIPFEINIGEKLICVIIINSEQDIHLPLICKSKLLFKDLEKLLYEKYPQYRATENMNVFLTDGNAIEKSKTLEENKIKDGQIIMLTVINESNRNQ